LHLRQLAGLDNVADVQREVRLGEQIVGIGQLQICKNISAASGDDVFLVSSGDESQISATGLTKPNASISMRKRRWPPGRKHPF